MDREVGQLQKAQQQMAILLSKLNARLRGNNKTENASAHLSRYEKPRLGPAAKNAQMARLRF